MSSGSATPAADAPASEPRQLDQLSRIEEKAARIEEKFARYEAVLTRAEASLERSAHKVDSCRRAPWISPASATRSPPCASASMRRRASARCSSPDRHRGADGDADRARAQIRRAGACSGACCRDELQHAERLDLAGKRVLVRVDLNVPMEDGKVTDATRIERVAADDPEISGKGAKVILLAHFGRPKGPSPEFSLKPVAMALPMRSASPLASPMIASATTRQGCRRHEERRGPAARKHPLPQGRREERPRLRQGARRQWRPLRQRRLLRRAPRPCLDRRPRPCPAGLAGRTMQAELEALEKGLDNPARPVVAIVGGAKVSTKLDLLGNLVKKVDVLVIGGGMANTFLAARGTDVGKSLCEHDLVPPPPSRS
jgi:hypothetical protein